MAWWDGTFDITDEELAAKYPVAITSDLHSSDDGSKMALICRFTDGDYRFSLADPHVEKEGQTLFYHVFIGDDARAARKFINRFIATGHGINGNEIDLIRFDADSGNMFIYSEGEICIDLIDGQLALLELLPESERTNDVFVLPLKRYLYHCPVCRRRTLMYRGMYDICVQCGWEDDGTDDEDKETGPNGDFTIRTYRENYLKIKNSDMNYHWINTPYINPKSLHLDINEQ